MAELYVATDPYPWPFNGDLRPENTSLIVLKSSKDEQVVGAVAGPTRAGRGQVAATAVAARYTAI
jgi:hypothetical protein